MSDKPGWMGGSDKVREHGARGGPATAPEEDDPAGVTHASRAYACLRGARDRADVIELRLLAADAPDQALEYSLRRRTMWDKADGAIVIEFVDGLRATIRGLGLHELKEKILRRMVTWVQEQGGDAREMKAAELAAKERKEAFVWVTEIVVEEPDADEED